MHPQHEGVLQALARVIVEAPDMEKAIYDGRPQLLPVGVWIRRKQREKGVSVMAWCQQAQLLLRSPVLPIVEL